MRVLFLFQTFSFKNSTIYLDLLRAMRDAGHKVTVIAGTADQDVSDEIQIIESMQVVYLKLEDQFGAGKIKKGVIQLSIEPRMKSLIKKRLWDEKFDLTAYPTPPVTLAGVADMCRKHYGCLTYLMLKDIFPQNAVDLHMMRSGSMLHRYFRRMEQKLYTVSDRIGCMSEANIEYMKKNISADLYPKLELFPNTVELKDFEQQEMHDGEEVRFVFGGNMGAPQAIDSLIEGIRLCGKRSGCRMAYFIFCGDGSEAGKIERFIEKEHPANFSYQHSMSRDSYEKMMKEADIGIVSLSSEFTIPNYPSRVLSYMQTGKPIFAVTDTVTDIRELIEDQAQCGWWCRADDPEAFAEMTERICADRMRFMKLGYNGRRYLEEHFDVNISVKKLEEAAEERKDERAHI